MTPISLGANVARRIIFVENDPLVLEFLNDLVSDVGYDCLLFTNPLDALEAIRHSQGELALVTDLFMHPMLGSDLAAEFRRLHPGQPVIIMTASVERVLPHIAEGDIVLRKPFWGRDLLSIITELHARECQLFGEGKLPVAKPPA
ncbi:response regulator [Rhodovastum atsumiense]|uniref:response regulator n=1 Tax=Rhodovastum atsumiense TaxID=504468 RepID=UPI00139F2B1D|nr:response regulator [Rhodovastum atsumiense]